MCIGSKITPAHDQQGGDAQAYGVMAIKVTRTDENEGDVSIHAHLLKKPLKYASSFDTFPIDYFGQVTGYLTNDEMRLILTKPRRRRVSTGGGSIETVGTKSLADKTSPTANEKSLAKKLKNAQVDGTRTQLYLLSYSADYHVYMCCCMYSPRCQKKKQSWSNTSRP